MSDFKYELDKEFGDHVLEEHGNTFFALRKIKWGSSSDYKLDLRKYYATAEGEQMSKGCVFNDECANELARVLVEKGYGDDEALYNAITKHRPYVLSRIYQDLDIEADGIGLAGAKAHIAKYPIPEEDEDIFFDLDEAVN